MSKIYTVEGNTSGGSTLVANGGIVAKKSYDVGYSRIAKIWRPMYKSGEAKKVIDKALTYVGYMEKKSDECLQSFKANVGYNNYTIFAKIYKEKTGIDIQGQPWCDGFVDVMFILALGTERAKELLGSFSAYTPTSSNLLKYAAKKEIKNPENAKAGDIIFFKNSQRICHTGLVRATSADTANKDRVDTVSNTYNKAKLLADMRKITGYIDYIQVFSHTTTISTTIHSNHASVLPVQKYLKSLGYYKGVPDRHFGKLTEEAVNQYQIEKLGYDKGDGEITAKGKMWRSLLYRKPTN